MNTIIYKLIIKYSKLNILFLTIVNLILISCLSFIITSLPIEEKIVNSTVESLRNENTIYAFFIIVIIGPLVETFIFQTTVIRVVLFFFEKHGHLAIFFSASLFSVFHCYSIAYAVWGFLAGIIFAYSYFIILKRKQNPFLVIFMLHALVNFIPFMIKFLVTN